MIMAAAAGGFLWLLPDLYLLLRVIGAAGIGAVVFGIAALLLRVDEAVMLPRAVLRRVRS